MPALLTCRDLSLRRGRKRLIERLSLTISAGELVHVRGHNGVGKSTLLSALAGLLRPDAGSIARPPGGTVAWLGHQSGLCAVESPHEALRLRARLHGQDDAAIGDALAALDIPHLAYRPVGLLSAGQQRRVALAAVLLQGAPLWVLDEPLTALDTAGVARVETLLDAHRNGGGAAVLTSHQPLTLPGVRCVDLGADT